jgi:aquaporin Z
MIRKLAAECVGTFWLVFGGCGSALIAAGFPEVGIGLLGVSLAFGLTVLTMAYALGPISGGHFNPAVSLGLVVGGRFSASELIPYWVAQVVGSVIAAALLFVIVSGQADFAGPGGFASNGYGEASPGKYSMTAAFLIEVILTAGFLVVILGATAPGRYAGGAPIAIGLALTLIHLVSIPVTNTSVNPARSTGVALFAEGPALAQLWLFWVAPLIGGAFGAIIWKFVGADEPVPMTGEGTAGRA